MALTFTTSGCERATPGAAAPTQGGRGEPTIAAGATRDGAWGGALVGTASSGPRAAEAAPPIARDAADADDGPMHVVAATRGDLATVLREESGRARARQLRPFAYLHASWCPPCRAIDRSLRDPRMVEAFQGAYVISLDVDDWGADRLQAVGLSPASIPRFYALAPDGRSTGRVITGAAWADDVPENMAPPLGAFLHAP